MNIEGVELYRPGSAVLLVISNPRITFRELLAAYQEVRREFGTSGAVWSAQRTTNINRVVAEGGTPPTKSIGQVAFWRRAMERWNLEFPDDRFKSWQGFRKAHRRTNTV